MNSDDVKEATMHEEDDFLDLDVVIEEEEPWCIEDSVNIPNEYIVSEMYELPPIAGMFEGLM